MRQSFGSTPKTVSGQLSMFVRLAKSIRSRSFSEWRSGSESRGPGRGTTAYSVTVPGEVPDSAASMTISCEAPLYSESRQRSNVWCARTRTPSPKSRRWSSLATAAPTPSSLRYLFPRPSTTVFPTADTSGSGTVGSSCSLASRLLSVAEVARASHLHPAWGAILSSRLPVNIDVTSLKMKLA